MNAAAAIIEALIHASGVASWTILAGIVATRIWRALVVRRARHSFPPHLKQP